MVKKEIHNVDESIPNVDVLRNPHALYCDDPSLTQQQFAGECDINYIVNRGLQAGVITHVNERTPQYADVSDVPDYQGAFVVVNRANALFNELPWQVRERFANNPELMLKFLMDPKNKEEGIKLGLFKQPDIQKSDPLLDTMKSIDSTLKRGVRSDKSEPKGE